MVGYITHNNLTIRYRSGGFEVLIGNGRFARLETLDQARAFIDGGCVVTTEEVYDLATGTLVVA